MRISKRPFNHLRFYRKQAGLQQKQVAGMLGLKSTSIISRWENSVSYPDLINAFKLAIIYGVMVDTLYRDLKGLIKQDLDKPNSASQLGNWTKFEPNFKTQKKNAKIA